MMDAVTQVVVWLNAGADALGRLLLAPIGLAPEWLSATAVAAVTGVVVLADGRREIWWNVRALRAGYHRLEFQVGGQEAVKEVAAGDGFMRVSTTRPGWSCTDALMHPAEPPFGPSSPVQSIEIQYPARD